MCRRLFAVLIVLYLLLGLTSPGIADDKRTVKMLGGSPDKITLTTEEKDFLDRANAERKAKGLPELIVAPLLVKVAREKSKEMHDLNYWGHESPVKEKRTAMRRLLCHLPEKPRSMIVGENLVFSTRVNVDEGHQALMHSPSHKKNILSAEYCYAGMGAFTAKDGRFWLTQIYLKIEY
ncbi:MAG: CAP domain-containing protein [Armatimonadota bacterium]